MDLPESGVFGEVFFNEGLWNDSTFSQIDLAGQYRSERMSQPFPPPIPRSERSKGGGGLKTKD